MMWSLIVVVSLINDSFVERATWSHNPQILFSLSGKRREIRENVTIRTTPRSLSSSSSCHPSSGGVRGRSPPIDDRRPIVRGSVFVERPHPPPRGRPRRPHVADLGWKGRRRWRKGDCERLHVDIGHPAVGGRGRTLSESTTGDVS